jgi:beta-glucanase (GH16 family)
MAIGDIINPETLNLTFDDEFTTFSSSPDGATGLWRTTLLNGDRTLGSNGEEEYYSDNSVGKNPFSDTNGVLDIQATPGTNALSLPYNSGVITTENSFNQLYGYFEIDAKMPAGQGLWPAFWLLPASGAWPPELDAFEVLGNNPTTLYFSTHSAVQATQGTTLTVSNVSAGFNLYGVMWGPQTVDLYINNVEVASMPTPADMNVPMYMLANLAAGGYWPGDPDSSTVFPANMLINYVRAYAYPGTTGGTVYDTTAAQNTGPAALAPVISAPSNLAAVAGAVTPETGISLAANWPGGYFTVVLSDSTGLLQTSATADVFTAGENTTTLTLTGNLAPLNAALASLTYQAAASGAEWIWVNATNPQGLQSTAHVAATDTQTAAPSASVLPVVTTPAAIRVAAGTTKALTGVSVTGVQAAANMSVTVSDSAGVLNAAPANALTVTGANSTSLTLNGSLAAIDAALTSLTYQAPAAPGTDWLWVSANDQTGAQALSREVVTVADSAAPCFCAGTRIATARGNVLVEKLQLGDLVKTVAQGFQPIKWIGTRTYDGGDVAKNHLALPVRIRRHALAFNIPARDLYVSPGHAICEGGVLVHAWLLINGTSITQASEVERVSYFHIELPQHAVIFAENCPVESFRDEVCRSQFENAASAPDWAVQPRCLPQVEDGFLLQRIQTRLNKRAGLRPSTATGALRGYIDETGPTWLCGWAQDVASPEMPVELLIFNGSKIAGKCLANRYRQDLRRAGLGSGSHAFQLPWPPALDGALKIQRASDGAQIFLKHA